MNALQNLNAAVATLTFAVDTAVAKLGQPAAGVPEADVQAAADQVSAQVARLNTAMVATSATPTP